MKLRTIGMAALAAVALVGNAQAQEAAQAPAGEGGWDTKYGILFTVPNLFGGNASAATGSGTAIAVGSANSAVINDFDGLVGFQYNLGPQTGIRIGVNLLRASCGRIETTSNTNVTTKLVCTDVAGPTIDPAATAGYNSHMGAKLAADYMMRMSTAAVAPYAGFGASIGFDRWALTGTDEASNSTIKTEYKNRAYGFGLGVDARLGLEWRIHKVVALFAEYQADLTLINRTSGKVDERTTGIPAYTSESKQLSGLNLTTGLAHQGKLGLVAFF